ncbi:MAG: hypothetical protein WCF36_02200 [Candidatus Nanopelagicales bacterium]
MDRRTFLGVSAAVLALTGCTGDPTGPVPPPMPPGAQDPDETVRAEVAAAEIGLIGSYRDLIAREPARAAELGPLLAHHEEHLALVAPGVQAPAPGVQAPTASSAGAGTSLADLVRAETAAVGQRTTACDGALDAGLARDLCRIAASEAQHVDVLAAVLAAEAR